MGKQKPKWLFEAEAEIDGMSNKALFDHTLDLTVSTGDDELVSQTTTWQRECDKAKYAQQVMRSRLVAAGFFEAASPQKPDAPGPLRPSPALLAKVGSIIVHVQEMQSPDGHAFDKIALDSLLADAEVREWLKGMGELCLLPLVRKEQ